MTSRKQSAIVSRNYRPEPDYCVRALKLLLKKSVNEGGPTITAPGDAKGSKHDRATEIIPEPS